MVDLTSSTLVVRFSLWVSREGNFPALFSPGPRIRGICLMRDSEARKASYFLAKNKNKLSHNKVLEHTSYIIDRLSSFNTHRAS